MKILMTLLILMAFSAVSEDDDPQVGDEVAIAIQNQSMYPMPAFYASPTEPVSYGTIAVINEISGEWYRITTSLNDTGWIHRTAVTGAIEGSSDNASASGNVTSDEIMLAGRGFSQDIEDTYAGEHPELDFSLVDQMESSWEVSSEELYQFLVEGNLIEDTGSSGSTTTTTTTETPRGSL